MPRATDHAAMVCGFVAAEGCFTATALERRTTFTFSVGLGAVDAEACRWMRSVLGCGTIHHYARRRPHYDDEVRFQVRKLRDLIEIVVPFMDEHLPPSYKRDQYLVWRAALLSYWAEGARRRHPCAVEGCIEPAVAHGRCHRHDTQWRRRQARRSS